MAFGAAFLSVMRDACGGDSDTVGVMGDPIWVMDNGSSLLGYRSTLGKGMLTPE